MPEALARPPVPCFIFNFLFRAFLLSSFIFYFFGVNTDNKNVGGNLINSFYFVASFVVFVGGRASVFPG